MQLEFANSDKVFEKILTNKTPTRAYKDPEKKKSYAYLRPIAAVCSIALILGTVGYLNRDFFVSADNANNAMYIDAETGSVAKDIYSESYSFYGESKEEYSGETIQIGSPELSNISMPEYLPEGYEVTEVRYFDAYNTLYVVEWLNDYDEYIHVTNFCEPATEMNVVISEEILVQEEKDGTLVTVIANGISEEEAKKILSSIN